MNIQSYPAETFKAIPLSKFQSNDNLHNDKSLKHYSNQI